MFFRIGDFKNLSALLKGDSNAGLKQTWTFVSRKIKNQSKLQTRKADSNQ